jgi:hypothetical protein
MSALAKGRNTPQSGEAQQGAYLVEAATVIYVGSLVALNDIGLAVPAQIKTSGGSYTNVPVIIGVMNNVVGGNTGQDCHNVIGANSIPTPPNLGAAGALKVNVLKGIFKFDNDVTAPVTQAYVGHVVFALDDHTISIDHASTVRPVAGTVVKLDADGVWIDTTKQSIASI